MNSRIKWYLNRLKTMNLPELFYRVGQAKQRILEEKFPRVPEYKEVSINKSKVHFDFSFFNNTGLDKFSIFGEPLVVDNNIDFHKDIFSGKSFPLTFSKTINTRSDQFGSAKVVWEVNRLQFLIPLIIRYKLTGDIAHLDLFVSIISSWDKQNPYMKGVNWYSNIEVNIRLINWYWCWILLEEDENWNNTPSYTAFKNNSWLPLIYRHCYYSYHNPSLYSSSNNHLISEYAGLFVANTLWKFKESDQWLSKSKEGLEKEICRQYSEKGVNKEEAAEYIQFITDFFLIAYVAGQHHGIEFSEKFTERLQAIFSYINSFLDIRHNFPKYGDEDDGKVIMPDGNAHENNFVSILNTAAVLLNQPEFKRQHTNWDLKSQLLTSHVNGKAIWDKMPFAATPSRSFFYKEEGHIIMRSKPTNESEIYFHFDAAPLGYLSIAAHGHADALSFLLHVDGYPFLVDPGTFTYHTHKAWRSYFVSTLAHNTITLNGEDQAELAGPTLWVNHFKTTVLAGQEGEKADLIEATHNGYQKQGFEHIRKVEFNKIENKFAVSDVIASKSKNPCQISMPFHFHPAVKVTEIGKNSYELSRNEVKPRIQLTIDPAVKSELIGAKDGIPLAWYSASFMKKEKSSVLMGQYLLETQQMTLNTVIKIIF